MNIRIRCIELSILLAALAAGYSAAAETAPEPIAVNALVEQALNANPGLKAARQRWSAELERPAQAKALPDPQLTVSQMTEKLETRAGPLQGKVGVSQRFPFFRKRALQSETASWEAKVAEAAYRSAQLKVRAQVIGAYYDLYYLNRAADILGEQVGFLRHFARVAEKKYAVGKGAQAMVFRAQAELSRLQNDVITAEQEAKSVRARLNALLNRKPWAEVGKPQAPEFPKLRWEVEKLRERALRERPELQALAALEGKTEAQRKLAFKRFFPDFLVGYEWTRIGAGTTMSSFDGKDAHGLSIGLNLPIWGGSLKAAHREAEAREKAASLSRADLVNRTLAELEDLAVRAETSVRLAKVDEESILPQIRAALQSTLSGYESDAVGFLDLLDAERALLNLELGHERHKVMFHQVVAELERVVGGEI
ncbi:MAG: TolC family protein [Elusimicrobiota bacterium]